MSGGARTDDDHRVVRESLGAWVLGALDGRERRDVAEHVDHCAGCAAEVAALSPLPGLLNRVAEDDLSGLRAASTPGAAERLDAHLARATDDVRRRLARWRTTAVAAVAVAAVAVGVVGVGVLRGGDEVDVEDRLVAAARPVAAAADATTGEAATLDWEWGTTVQLELADLPARDAYVVWVVADDGRREQAGTWGTTRSRGARVYGASSIPREEVARIEVTSAVGELLVTFGFPGT